MVIDNNQFPAVQKSMAVRRAEQVIMFGQEFIDNYWCIPYTNYKAKAPESRGGFEYSGSFSFNKFNNPILHLVFPSALSHACTVHIFPYGRARYSYENGNLTVGTR
jgi:hypothetical protein